MPLNSIATKLVSCAVFRVIDNLYFVINDDAILYFCIHHLGFTYRYYYDY